MTQAALFWGEGTLPGNLLPLEDVFGAPLLTTQLQSIQTVYPFIVLRPLTTTLEEDILDIDGVPLLAYVPGVAPPRYFESAEVAQDGGVLFGFRYVTAPWQPAGQGGENVFAWLYLTISWSMAATIRVTPYTDGTGAPVALPDGSVLENVSTLFSLPQEGGTLQRRTQVFPIPLVRKQVRGGEEVARWNLRGQRLQFALSSTGPLGVGECMLEGAQVDYRPVRKSEYAPVDARG
jgi:hypothetical protein